MKADNVDKAMYSNFIEYRIYTLSWFILEIVRVQISLFHSHSHSHSHQRQHDGLGGESGFTNPST